MQPYKTNRVYLADAIDAMQNLPDDSVDIAIADPPYNLSKGGTWKWDNRVDLPGLGGNWTKVMAEWDRMSFADYFKFTLAWLVELKRVVRPTGSLWVHGTYHNSGIINVALQLLEIEIINEVVWLKRNSFPNLSGRRLTASHETILWAHTGGPQNRRYFFAYRHSKEMACAEDKLKIPGKQMRTVWDIPNNKSREEIKYGKHPTQKPLRLLTRMLEISSQQGDLLLVPFAGAGSDCVAAKQLGINFIGFDNDPDHIAICQARLKHPAPHVQLSLSCAPQVGPQADHPDHAAGWHTARRTKSIPSLIKWTGSKRSQANAIAKLMPTYRRYFEPFLGGGSLLFLAAAPGAVAGDSYGPLIELWRMLQRDHHIVVDDYTKKWHALNDELNTIDQAALQKGHGLPRFYYEVRDNFNQNQNPLDLNFLMRTCVNGIVRFNKEGQFNNSFHLSRRGMRPDRFKKMVDAWLPIIREVAFVCQDYRQTMHMAERDDFVYCDPPYAGCRQRYQDRLDLNQLFDTLQELNQRKVKWALSFDGIRGDKVLIREIPPSLYKRQLFLSSGKSAVKKVLNDCIENVKESLYLNY
jgi:DNA adenine methylase Dam